MKLCMSSYKGKIYSDSMNDNANDNVNSPSHYADSKIEVIDYIEDKKLG